MPSVLDIAFAVLFSVVIATIGGAYFDRRFKRQAANGVPDARRNWYRLTLIGEWALVAVTLALWFRERRDWRPLGLVPPTDWRLYLGVALAAIVTAMLLRQNVKIRALSPDDLHRLTPKFTDVEFIIPRSPREYRWFQALSVTAGVCEELLYRGFLTWVVAAYVGTWAALFIVAVMFGLGHAYQGPTGIVKTGVVGLVLGCIVLASGWLIPAMIIHAMIDSASGIAGYAVLGQATRHLAPDHGIIDLPTSSP